MQFQKERGIGLSQLAVFHIIEADFCAVAPLHQVFQHRGFAYLTGSDQQQTTVLVADSYNLVLESSLDVIHTITV